MINFAVFPYFLLTVALVVAIPGANTIYVSTASASQGFKFGLASCFGIMLGTLVHVSFAAMGITALLMASPALLGATKLLGASYLVYLGVKSITKTVVDTDTVRQTSLGLGESIKKGFLVNLLNPKTALFIAAFLPQFVDPASQNIPLQIFLLGVILIVIGGISDILYAAAASKIGKMVANTRRTRSVGKYVTGAIYIGLGIVAATASNGSTK